MRPPKLARFERDLLVRLVDQELAESVEFIGKFTDIDRRRIMRDYIEQLEAVRAKLVRLKCKV